MQSKSIAWWLWLIPIAFLLMAVARMPYGYYTVTKIVVCGSAVFLAVINWADGGVNRGWAVAFALIAILFNPLIPVYLKRATWLYFDFAVAAVFAAHLVLVRLVGTKARQA